MTTVLPLESTPPNQQASPADKGKAFLEEEKLAFEREKLSLEREKFALERTKVALEGRRVTWTALATGVPLLVVALSAFSAVQAQKAQARAQFQLKAAELVVGTDDPYLAQSRSAVLRQLFPELLPTDFAVSFDAHAMTSTNFNDRLRIAERIMGLDTKKQSDLLDAYSRVFKGDEWVQQWLADCRQRD
jgi:hypothetical protein